jgi:hypothetical protein
MNGWKEKFLSHACKEIPIKLVLQAIPTYTMSVFRLPTTLCREINMLISFGGGIWKILIGWLGCLGKALAEARIQGD